VGDLSTPYERGREEGKGIEKENFNRTLLSFVCSQQYNGSGKQKKVVKK